MTSDGLENSFDIHWRFRDRRCCKMPAHTRYLRSYLQQETSCRRAMPITRVVASRLRGRVARGFAEARSAAAAASRSPAPLSAAFAFHRSPLPIVVPRPAEPHDRDISRCAAPGRREA